MKTRVPRNVRDQIRAASREIILSIDSSAIPECEKKKIRKVIKETESIVSEIPDTFVYKTAVGAIGMTTILIALGIFFLASIGGEIPDSLETALGTALGALAGMLVPAPKSE